jgi:predicted enzyme related to lactoylglutathione lyase
MSKFFWYDVITPEPRLGIEFYRSVMEWTTEAMATPEGEYTVFSASGVGTGGLMGPPAGALRDFPNAVWNGYIWVQDVDATTTRIVAGGGTIRRAAWDVPDVGRMAVVADPGGVIFKIMTGSATGHAGSCRLAGVAVLGRRSRFTILCGPFRLDQNR